MIRLLLLSLILSSCASTGPRRGIASWHSCYETLSSVIYHSNKSSRYGANGFHFAKNLAEAEELYGDESFFSIQGRLSNDEIRKNNTKLRTLLNRKEVIDQPDAAKATRLSENQASTLYDDMTSTPCVRNDSPYQQPGVALGYCFGRAIVSHFHALRRGVHPQAMKKIWVVGDMGHWGHHVAYMVRGDEGKWFVIDNVTGLVPHNEWMNSLKTFQRGDKEVMFFVTEANRFGPESNRAYTTADLFNVQNRNWNSFDRENDYYRGFFRDFFEWLDQQPEPAQF